MMKNQPVMPESYQSQAGCLISFSVQQDLYISCRFKQYEGCLDIYCLNFRFTHYISNETILQFLVILQEKKTMSYCLHIYILHLFDHKFFRSTRTSWREERKLNTETFGASDYPRRNFRGGRGWVNRGYRGGGGRGGGGGYYGGGPPRGGGGRGNEYVNQCSPQLCLNMSISQTVFALAMYECQSVFSLAMFEYVKQCSPQLCLNMSNSVLPSYV